MAKKNLGVVVAIFDDEDNLIRERRGNYLSLEFRTWINSITGWALNHNHAVEIQLIGKDAL